MQAGIATPKTAVIAAGVAAVAMFVASIPGFICVDRWGRRTCTLVGGAGLCTLMLLIGSLYAAGSVGTTGAARWVVVVAVFLFGIVFCTTWGIVSKIYASEIQPGHTRAAGNSVGMAFSFVSWPLLWKAKQRANNSLRIGSSRSSRRFCSRRRRTRPTSSSAPLTSSASSCLRCTCPRRRDGRWSRFRATLPARTSRRCCECWAFADPACRTSSRRLSFRARVIPLLGQLKWSLACASTLPNYALKHAINSSHYMYNQSHR